MSEFCNHRPPSLTHHNHLLLSFPTHELPACSVIRDWQRQHGFASLAVRAVGELQHAAVGFSDLAAQDQSNQQARKCDTGFRRELRDEDARR
jgi:hypothetical protein